ncbi:MAG TPA: phosphoribosylamine--glycine ligase [Candidatus Thermoplasmatota archaeon]|jgi:phosphoribosylamine--glycine ligase|nr:phosphoribosylamine--glycine ligase [Candidatus Thermoplasmatota archaeon]
MTRVLLIGGGAREHAMAQALVRSGAELFVVSKARNPGLARLAKDSKLAPESDVRVVTEAARAWRVELVLAGPEAPLEAGTMDALAAQGVRVASPTKAAAEVETSKAYLRDLMDRHRLDGRVRHTLFTSPAGLGDAIRALGSVAIKPVGLTGGKGVKVSGDHLRDAAEAEAYARDVLAQRIGGSGGVLVEEKLEGEEFTLQAFCDGATLATMPAVQDHKRAFEGDTGPNTGGMGSYSDRDGLLPFLTRADLAAAERILRGIVAAMAKDGRPYRGAIYGQFMLTADGPKVIECNARFGDPEAMNVLGLLASDYLEACEAIAAGTLSHAKVRFEALATVCKYVVPPGYGAEGGKAGIAVRADEAAIQRGGAQLFWAAVHEDQGRIATSTSRTCAILAKAPTLAEAEGRCEAALEHVRGEGLRARHDIGKPELLRRRVEHMQRLLHQRAGRN